MARTGGRKYRESYKYFEKRILKSGKKESSARRYYGYWRNLKEAGFYLGNTSFAYLLCKFPEQEKVLGEQNKSSQFP